jgi:prolyl 4-hydroxylase
MASLAPAAIKDPFCSPRKLSQIGHTVTRSLNAHPDIQHVDVPGAQIYVYQDFLSDADCQYLIDKMDAESVPSTLYKGTQIDGFRTSYSCHLSIEDAHVERIEERMAKVLGIPNAQAETMQGQRYAVGQEFMPHHDFFHITEDYWQQERKKGGQRCWTAVIYLNQPDEGGETEFTELGIGIQPRKGMMVIWNNMNPDGTPNEKTLHWGKPVIRGTKYIVTKWYRMNEWLTINYPQYKKRRQA